MTTSENIGEIAAALAQAQSEMEGAKKDTVNPFFKSKYPDLASVREAVNGPLTKHGIAVIQSPSAEGATVSVVTLLAHSSGQWMRGVASCTAKDDSAQAIGSATTYLRRYALQAFAGVAPADDDAETAQGRGNGQTSKPVAVPNIPKGYDEWLIDYSAAADEGYVRLREAWKESKPEYREYMSTTDQKRITALADKAKAVTAAKSDPAQKKVSA